MGGGGGVESTVPIARWCINAVFVSAAGVDGIADHYSGIDSLVYSGKHSVTVTDILFLRSTGMLFTVWEGPNIRYYSRGPRSKVEDLYHFNVDPDPPFHFIAGSDPDSDPAFYFNADADPVPLQSDGNLRSLVYRSCRAPTLHYKRPRPPTALF